MIPYNEWAIVCEDEELDVRSDPQELEGYGLNIKGTENYLLFPRGTLREIARTDKINGRRIIERLLPYQGDDFFERSPLNYDSLIAIVTKAYIEEQERFEQWKDENPQFTNQL